MSAHLGGRQDTVTHYQEGHTQRAGDGEGGGQAGHPAQLERPGEVEQAVIALRDVTTPRGSARHGLYRQAHDQGQAGGLMPLTANESN